MSRASSSSTSSSPAPFSQSSPPSPFAPLESTKWADLEPEQKRSILTAIGVVDPTSRLSLSFGPRITLTTFLGLTAGLGLGLTQGATVAGLRFRAENAHRLPTNKVGWYLYHKSKNYAAMWGALGEGRRMGLRIGFWVATFGTLEEAVDRGRGRMKVLFGRGRGEGQHVSDALSSVVAGLSTAGAFSLWNRFPMPTAARTAKMGLRFGLGYGILQDVVGVLKGRRVGYIDWIIGRSKSEVNVNS
ncbi:MAG: hypothetical protein M1820_007226 [Bogoriella megaspora]|nr:MAG: hypothetical protein M1820_007226 [Bogoriella megaspora]